MLVELAILAASCNATGAALGICESECPTATGAGYTICSIQQETESSVSNPSTPKPQRLCSYYVNGTIDVPTLSIITAWIDVGSRLCIGDPPPVEYAPVVRTIEEQVMDVFTAYAAAPFAYFSPNREIEITEPVSFGVNLGGGTHGGSLFGSPAEIRFVPSGVGWTFSDGQSGSGSSLVVAFSDPATVTAYANVQYRIDYRLPSANWVLGAASASLNSNTLSLQVIDPPRRSLLRD